MHPNPLFRPDADQVALLARVARIGFAQLFAVTPAGPMVAHVPLTAAGDRLRFHLARANRLAPHLDGATVLASVAGPEGYISPGWYASPQDQVPTWNYTAIEIDGVALRLSEAELIAQLDTLAAAHEPRVTGRPWTRDQLDGGRFRTMLAAIIGFEITVSAVRGTTKLSQNKSAADRAGVIAGLIASGNHALADAMEVGSTHAKE